ncbi:TIGR03987 family protein, partial [Clostridium sp. 2-1]|uniref:HsmA family protein n=1 Tax=Clostridium sp. 2-1 TaxID=2070758 RepID=UPI000CDA6A80
MLLYAIIFITSALIFYTVGVWGEKLKGSLNGAHLIFFWIGLVCDTTGTTLMSKLANDVFSVSFHSVTGLLAIVLMLVHAVWA